MRTSMVGIVAALVVLLGAGGVANAQVCGTLGNAKDFDLFVHGDYAVGNTQVQGRVAVGGNARIATSGGYAVGTQLAPAPSRVDLLARPTGRRPRGTRRSRSTRRSATSPRRRSCSPA
jgi:hypothetical protein